MKYFNAGYDMKLFMFMSVRTSLTHQMNLQKVCKEHT
jgi:hypothetical protein